MVETQKTGMVCSSSNPTVVEDLGFFLSYKGLRVLQRILITQKVVFFLKNGKGGGGEAGGNL